MNRHLSGEEFGEQTERRFIEAISHWEPNEPPWFCGFEEADALLDMRGVDFIVWVKYRGVREPLPVPVQIKSSLLRMRLYFEKHPAAKEAGVVVLAILPDMKPGRIRNALFQELAKVRDADRQFEAYLERISRSPISDKRGIGKKKAIEKRRALRATRITPRLDPAKGIAFLPPPPSRWEWLYLLADKVLTLVLRLK